MEHRHGGEGERGRGVDSGRPIPHRNFSDLSRPGARQPPPTPRPVPRRQPYHGRRRAAPAMLWPAVR